MIALKYGLPMKEIFSPNYGSIWDFCLDNSFPGQLLVSLGNDWGKERTFLNSRVREQVKHRFFCCLIAKSCLTL